MPNPNRKSLSAQIAERDRMIAALEERISKADAEGERLARAVDAGDRRVADCKMVIAGLREEVAELKGYIRRSNEIEDARAERVPIESPTPVLAPRTRIDRQEFEIDSGNVNLPRQHRDGSNDVVAKAASYHDYRNVHWTRL